MKTTFLCLTLAFASAGLHAEQSDKQSKHSVVRKELDARVWARVTSFTNAAGKASFRTNSFTEIGTGMHYEENGQLVESSSEIELNDDGAAGLKTRHKVKFSANANDWDGAVDLRTPDNKRFRSRVLGLSYWDSATGQSVFIAELKDCVGVLQPDKTQIVYPDAFTDVHADIRYRNFKAGLEQDIIIRDRLPSPTEWGLDPKTTRLQVLTEFFDPPCSEKNRSCSQGDQCRCSA